ncbi:hydroxyacid dehydrogenase [Candidatus Gottesmanbacteria bacterium]|nr:hydroxyacid dehydrogenase [Candidatus Gottesmanbacteria bacterium]
MKTVFFEVEPWEKPILSSALSSHTLVFHDDALTSEVGNDIVYTEILSAFIYSKLNQKVLSQLTNLKLIATRSTGFDHIDLEYCKNRGITVCNVPTYGVNTIAEHTIALILALSRKLIPSIERTRRGNFTLDGLRGADLAGKTLGIVGLGHIGMRVMELAKAFKMNILVTTGHPDPNKAKTLGITFVDLSTLLAKSDIVSLHVPLNTQTTYLINKTNITSMKKGSLLINTARGAIVETEAIVWALEQGILAGAGIDVLEEECVLKEERELLTKEFLKTCDLKTQLLNHVLLTKENVIITPHNAFNSNEALQEILTVTIGNIISYISGTPTNTISLG